MKRTLAILILLVTAWGVFSASGFAATSISSSSAAPVTIVFNANNPDTPTVSGSPAATVTFTTNNGAIGNTWQVQVQATAANFGSCPSSVLASQVRVACTSATVSGGTGGGSGSCGGAFVLSTGLQTVASGTEATGVGSSRPTYTVTLGFTFTDSWSFIPASCTLGLSYFITAN